MPTVRRAILVLIPCILLIQPGHAYETSLFSLICPAAQPGPALELHISHRLYGPVNDRPLETYFGINTGVYANIGLRYLIWSRIEAGADCSFFDRSFTLSAGYSHPFLPGLLQGRIVASVYNYGTDGRKTSFFTVGSLTGGPFWKRVSPVVNVGFDGDDNTMGLGAGVNVSLFEFLDVAGEYLPVLMRPKSASPSVNAFSFGAIIRTWHHQFHLFLSNCPEVELRRIFKGGATNDLHIGFSIKRLFDVD